MHGATLPLGGTRLPPFSEKFDFGSTMITYNEVQALKKEHKGKRYRWLPSGALNPDPEHQLLYGQIFNVGEGDKDGNMPGERYGCQCGIEWIDD